MTEESHSIDTATGAEAPAELSQERVRRIFGAIARQYRRFNAFSSFGLYRSWMRRTVDAAGLTPASRMIDLAGGTGDISFAAARRNPPAHIQPFPAPTPRQRGMRSSGYSPRPVPPWAQGRRDRERQQRRGSAAKSAGSFDRCGVRARHRRGAVARSAGRGRRCSRRARQ